jgi:hypothetical protein
MSGLMTAYDLYELYKDNYDAEKQKADAKYDRAQHRAANTFNLENITNTIYNDIIETAKKTRDGYSIHIVEEGETTDGITNYFNEIYCNSRVDVSGNDILNVLSKPILRIVGNNLYDLYDGEVGQLLISGMTIQGEIDISGANVVVDASDNVLFKLVSTVNGSNILGADDSLIGTITEDKLSDNVITNVLSKFIDVSGQIETILRIYSDDGLPPPPNKKIVFGWNVGEGNI